MHNVYVQVKLLSNLAKHCFMVKHENESENEDKLFETLGP